MNIDKLLASLTEDQKRELLEALVTPAMDWENEGGSILDKESDSNSPEVGEDFIVKDRKSNHEKRRSQVRGFKNEWEDTGEHRDPEYDDTHLEKTPRGRSAPKKVRMTCHVCGKSFRVNKGLVCGEFIRCNRCTGR